MTPEAFAYLTRLSSLRVQFSGLRAELKATSDHDERAAIFEEAVATLHRIRELERGDDS